MSDDEIAAMPYRDLWLQELGAVVPEHHEGDAARRPYPAPELDVGAWGDGAARVASRT